MKDDINALADSVFTSIKGYVGKALAAVTQRVQALEKRLAQLPAPQKGDKGEKGDRGDPAVFLVGDGPPLSAGKAGAIYLDAKSGDIYRCV